MFEILEKRRDDRGALDIETTESKLILNEEDQCIDIVPRTRGISEQAIEEFMLLANESAALTARNYPAPFVYRVHENPPQNKLENLYELLKLLGFSLTDGKKSEPENLINQKLLCKILKQSREKGIGLIVNTNILRSMAKAKYSNEPLGHFGLVLDDYAHFTSPIRRYPDLCIHRILNDICNKMSQSELNKKYESFVVRASVKSTEREIEAMKLERSCDDYYKAEFMQKHIGDDFVGTISSVTSFGIYVELENTCEGLIRIAGLSQGDYDYSNLRLKNMTNGKEYKIGDEIKVKVSAVDVNAGNIDFKIIE
ncbi:MAG: RNB domain-containing ribonuclease [Clostridia bacterium]